MKWLLANLGVNLVALACVVFGGLLALRGVSGWGWFLVVAVICASVVEFSTKETRK